MLGLGFGVLGLVSQFLKGGYIVDYTGDYFRVMKGILRV